MPVLFPKLNNISIRNKLILAFIIVVLIPTFFVGLLITFRFRQAAIDNAIVETDNSVKRVNKIAADMLRTPMEISGSLLFDTRLEKLLNTKYETVVDAVIAYREYERIREYMTAYNRQIVNIKIYINNPTLVNNWVYIVPDENIKSSFWYKNTLNAKGGLIGWYYIEDETKGNEKFLSLVRRIRFSQYNRYALMVIDINKAYLNSILSQEPFDTLIIDSANNVVATNRSRYMEKNLRDTDIPLDVTKVENGTFEKNISGKNSRIAVYGIKPEASLNGLRVISVFAVDNILKESDQILTQGFIIIFSSSVFAVILIFIASYLLSGRIMKLSKRIKQVAGGNLDTVFDIAGSDEIGQLSNQFAHMVSSVKQLINEVNTSNRQKSELLIKQNELRLKMMASQINPHFLFNALESIRLKLLVNGEKDTSKTVKTLGILMRKKLEIYTRNVLLKNELEMVGCYLDIEKFRYEDRLNYELKIEPESENIMIPAFIIQPLVENAVRHGMAEVDGNFVVCVQTRIINNDLFVEVVDNGEGINDEKMEKIRALLNDPDDHEGEGIGLHNVHMRLRLSYEENSGLIINSKLHEGARVSFSLPIGGLKNV